MNINKFHTDLLAAIGDSTGAPNINDFRAKFVEAMGDLNDGGNVANKTEIAALTALAGTRTGSGDGTIADVSAVSTAGGNTYAGSAINTAITSINLQLKELQTKLNAIVTALKA